jgi:hypothetical protein
MACFSSHIPASSRARRLIQACVNRFIFQILWLADILLATVSMIIFLAVLLSRQKN